jgi:hypothetical protein
MPRRRRRRPAHENARLHCTARKRCDGAAHYSEKGAPQLLAPLVLRALLSPCARRCAKRSARCASLWWGWTMQVAGRPHPRAACLNAAQARQRWCANSTGRASTRSAPRWASTSRLWTSRRVWQQVFAQLVDRCAGVQAEPVGRGRAEEPAHVLAQLLRANRRAGMLILAAAAARA